MPADEPYLWEHLAHHLVEAGHSDELVVTVKDWRYLVAKTLIRKSLTVEADLVVAEKIANDDELLRLLRRHFVNSGHLLNRCEKRNDIETTLFSRLQHLDEFKSLTTDLKQHVKRPFLVPALKLPDLPHPALIRTLSSHSGWVRGCAVSADGTTIISAHDDKTLKVWDGRTGAERFTLIGHADVVRDCAVSADGVTIISASDDGTLKVWDGRRGAERLTLSGHAGGVNGCAVSADGATVISASADKTVKLWDGQNGAERFTLIGHADVVSSCAMSADGTTIISASNDGTLKVWDGQRGVERLSLIDQMGGVHGCAMNADGTIIVSAFSIEALIVWDGRNGSRRFILSHGGGIGLCRERGWNSDCVSFD